MSIHQMYGLLAEKHEQEIAEHRKTIGILAALKSGTLRLDQLEVDATAARWSIRADAVDRPEANPEA